MKTPHFHVNEQGVLIKCYHETKAMLVTYQFWISTLIAFPIEHFVWDYLPPFKYLTHWLGL